MRFFRRRKNNEEDRHKAIKQAIAGLIIGGAIASVIGKKILHKHEKDIGDEEEDTKE